MMNEPDAPSARARNDNYHADTELFSLAKASKGELDWLECLNTWLAQPAISPAAGGLQALLRPPSSSQSSQLPFERLCWRLPSPSPNCLPTLQASSPPRVTVAMACFNNAETLEAAASSVLAQTLGEIDLIIVDDASSDGSTRLAARIAREDSRVRLIVNRRNLGTYACRNRALALSRAEFFCTQDADDIALPGRLERQIEALDAARGAMGVVSRLVRMTADGHPVAMNVEKGGFAHHAVGTLLIRRQPVLERIGYWDEVRFGADSEYMERLRAALGTSALLWHDEVVALALHRPGSLTQSPESALYGVLGPSPMRRTYKQAWEAWHRSHAPVLYLARGQQPRPFPAPADMLSQRAAIAAEDESADAQAKGTPAGARRAFRVLSVTANPGGGVPQTHRDIARGLLAQYPGVEVWHLNAQHTRLRLARLGIDGSEAPPIAHELATPVAPSTHESGEYTAVIEQWLARLQPAVVHVHHLAGHGLALLRLARAAGARVVLTFHDFYHLCPTIKLLDAEGNYCGGRCTTGQADCRPEPGWQGSSLPRLRGAWVGHWRNTAASALRHAHAFTAPHAAVRDTVRANLPLPADVPFEVIEHGRDFAAMRAAARPLKSEQPLEILVPGNLVHAKGLALVRELARLDEGRRLRLHLLGPVLEALPRSPSLVLHGAYLVDSFVDKVAAIRPHLGAVLSILHETWCHTLTEMWACGLPVVAFDFPTVAARIHESGAGWVWPLESAQALYQRLLALDPADIARKTTRAAGWKRTLQQQDTRAMATRYAVIYGLAGKA
jgi:glycosyltransferase involved in cell wall biosynthesis